MKDKKSMIMVIIIGITLCLFFCFNTTVFATTGTVTTGELRLRKESSTSSDVLDLLEENQEVEILSEDGDWYKVKVNKQVGYVNKQYVKVNENSNIISNETTSNENKTEENKEDNKEENKTETVTKVTVNSEAKLNSDSQIRIIPLVSGDVTNTAKENQTFKIVSTLGAWSYIENSEMSGWILTQDLSIINSNTQEDVQEESNEENNEQNNSEETVEETVNEEKMYDAEKTYYVSGTSVNVRAEASKSSDVKDVLYTNDEVSVIGESGEWYIVSINGSKGYIAKTLLSTTKKEVTSRSTNTVEQSDEDNEEHEESSVPAAPEGSATGEAIASYAQQFVGYPYVYGASGPNSFDCSGFAQYVYKQFGYYINRTADSQAYNGYYVSKDELALGDLVFFNTSGNGISHVGIYIGDGQFVHASTSRTGVKISSLYESYYVQRYVTARRIA